LAAAAALRSRLDQAEAALTDAERTRLADLAAAEALRARLAESDTELTAMTLALEAERRRAEETLTLLAAAQAAQERAEQAAAGEMTDASLRTALLSVAQQQIAQLEDQSADDRRRLALLNEQVAALRGQVAQLQDLLGASRLAEIEAQTQIESLGSDLNAALARAAFEERRRADLEAERARRLAEEAQQLERYRSEFFGLMRDLLAGREGVRIVGDRFVFSSEVLFETGSADLAPEGRAQIAGVAEILTEVARDIPPSIDWILRVDGHTDARPITIGGRFANNWELSQARALSVVLFLTEELGFPPDRLVAAGFGEHRPVASGDSPLALAANRRIELKLTER
jgi:chemotaxis protein MotB